MIYILAVALRLGVALLVLDPPDLDIMGSVYTPLFFVRGRWPLFALNLAADLIIMYYLGKRKWVWALSPLSIAITGAMVYPDPWVGLGILGCTRGIWIFLFICGLVKGIPGLWFWSFRDRFKWWWVGFLTSGWLFVMWWTAKGDYSAFGWPILVRVLGGTVQWWLAALGIIVGGMAVWLVRNRKGVTQAKILGLAVYALGPFVELHHLIWIAPLMVSYRWHLWVGGFVAMACLVGYLYPVREAWLVVSAYGLLVWASFLVEIFREVKDGSSDETPWGSGK